MIFLSDEKFSILLIDFFFIIENGLNFSRIFSRKQNSFLQFKILFFFHKAKPQLNFINISIIMKENKIK